MSILNNWHEPQSTKFGSGKVWFDTPIRSERDGKECFMMKMRSFEKKERVAEIFLSKTEAEEIYRALHLLLMKPR